MAPVTRHTSTKIAAALGLLVFLTVFWQQIKTLDHTVNFPAALFRASIFGGLVFLAGFGLIRLVSQLAASRRPPA